MNCNVKKALALAYSIILCGEKITEKHKTIIDSALNSDCIFQKVAEGFLELYDEGLLCCGCSYQEQGAENCLFSKTDDKCGIRELAEKALIALGEGKTT